MKSTVALAIAVASLAAGCSTINELLESRKVDYKTAGRLPPLEVPPDLTRPTADDRFAVPDINPSGSATYSAYSKERAARPAAATNPEVLPKVDNARIERAGTQRWLVVDGTPEALWPAVKAFWQELGFLVNVEVPEAGVMETDWAENRARIDDGIIRNTFSKLFGSISSTAERDKFRTRLERGGNGTTEIYISHRGMIEVFSNTQLGEEKTMWQPRPADPDMEAEMLRRLMVRFGVQEARAQADLQRASTATRARITRASDGSGHLSIDDQFDRAWRRVGLALDRVGFTVEDRDRSKGLYFVRYVDPEADARSKKASGGLLSKLAFWRDDDDPKARDAQYRIAVKDAASGSEVNVLNKDGHPDRSPTANRILTLLYEQLK